MDDVDSLNLHVSTSIASFERSNKEFQAAFENQNQIIFRYDEVLQERATKLGLDREKRHLTDYID
jgi:hypothetical protein